MWGGEVGCCSSASRGSRGEEEGSRGRLHGRFFQSRPKRSPRRCPPRLRGTSCFRLAEAGGPRRTCAVLRRSRHGRGEKVTIHSSPGPRPPLMPASPCLRQLPRPPAIRQLPKPLMCSPMSPLVSVGCCLRLNDLGLPIGRLALRCA